MRVRADSVLVGVIIASILGCSAGCSAARESNEGAAMPADESAEPASPSQGSDRPPASTPPAGSDGDNGKPSDVYPAPHLDAPTVSTRGGPILGSPRIVPITFQGDPYADEIGTFAYALARSAYWSDATSEYGVGALRVTDPVREHDVPPTKMNDFAIQKWLTDALDGSHPDWPAPDGSTIYAFYFPSDVAFDDQRWGKGCIDVAGYHWELELANGTRVPYIVIPRCPSFRDLHGFDVVTATSSHELIEAATDPLPESAPAYAAVDEAHEVWTFFPFSEIGDMCSVNAGATFRPRDLDYLVQHTWSNVAARAHHDPCGGVTAGIAREPSVYFNSVPELREDVTIDLLTNAASTKGVKIPIGETRTIEIALFSDGPTSGPWTVTAKDVGSLNGKLPQLAFALDRAQGVNGEKLHLTITALREGQNGGAELMLVSTLGDRTSTWFGFVAN